jgi:signal transduction histidine kinase/ActR/RegA family two-component response regulator
MSTIVASANWIWTSLERIAQYVDVSANDGKLRAGLFISLLSVWLLVGVFTYLNHYTRRKYFSIWTVAWLFYAVYLTTSYSLYWYYGDFDDAAHHRWWATMLKQWAISTAAVFMLWGSLRFLGKKVRQTMLSVFLIFLFVWSFAANWRGYGHIFEEDSLWLVQMPIFLLIGVSSVVTVWGFAKYRHKRKYLGAGLLTFGFLFWGFFVAAYPLLQQYAEYMSTAFFIASVLQMFIAVNMIILVLEQVRYLREKRALNQLKNKEREKTVLQSRVFLTEERYRKLFEQSSEPIVIATTDQLLIVGLNEAASRLLGIPLTEGERYSLMDFFAERVAEPPTSPPGPAWFELVSGRRFLVLLRKDGGQVNVELFGSAIDFAGETAFQCYLREITDKSRWEQQMRRAEKLSTLGLMVSSVAHELNNPLMITQGYLELALQDPALSKTTRDHLEKASLEGQTATRRLRNFLNLSREGGEQKQKFDLNEIIQNVIELRHLEFMNAGVEVQLALAPGVLPVEANLEHIQQVILVLVTNAIQALAGMDRAGCLRISTQRDSGLATVRFEDNGPGVPAHLRSKIFEPFFTTKPVGIGTGLGLSIAHSYLVDHHGRLYYQDSCQGGAGFTFELPLSVQGDAASPSEALVDRPGTAAAAPLPEVSILVVDDNVAITDLLSTMLDILGHRTTVCHSGGEALERVKTQDYGLIFCDLHMPGMNGQEFFEAVAQIKPALVQKCVLISGDEQVSEFTSRTPAHGGFAVLTKPFSLSSLEKVTKERLEKPQASSLAA